MTQPDTKYDEMIKRVEAAEARIVELATVIMNVNAAALTACVDDVAYRAAYWEEEARAARRSLAEAEERVHYAEGTANANIDRANAAEARIAELDGALDILSRANQECNDAHDHHKARAERYRGLIERWEWVRKTVISASIYPVGNEAYNEAYKVALNELSEAEAALNDTED